ncbi:MAG: hypothetical protein E7Z99_03205 [Coriobacteriaceae bacterium]|jgi:hypothetical protein|nr:hypothetical protein [Coriobacteriaceae bacterium]
MKKSNVVAFIVAIVISAFLLWLWYWLGFDHIDAPLDLVLSIIWWILVAVLCVVIYRVEKKRQERVRTCYISSELVYNSEAGAVPSKGMDEAVERIHDIVNELEYTFDVEERPESVSFDYVVRSAVFKMKQEADEENGVEEELDWRGEVAVAGHPDDDPIPFDGREELRNVLGRLTATAA